MWNASPKEISRSEGYLDRFNALVATDVPAYNKMAADQGVPTLFVGDPIHVEEPGL